MFKKIFNKSNKEDYKLDLSKNACYFGAKGTGFVDHVGIPSIKQAVKEGSSFVVTDFKGYILKNYEDMLRENGYDIKVLNLDDFSKSTNYNPMAYISCQSDIPRLTDCIVTRNFDGFLADTTKSILTACIAYQYETNPAENRILRNAALMLRMAEIHEDEVDLTELDCRFNELAEKNSNSYAARLYQIFKMNPKVVIINALVEAIVHLHVFEFDETMKFSSKDEMNLANVGKKKTALFIQLSEGAHNTDFIATCLVDQLVRILLKQGDENEDKTGKKALNTPVKFIFNDDLRILPFIPALIQKLATCRKYGISFTMRFFSLDTLRKIENSEMILANCDTVGILGGTYLDKEYTYINNKLGIVRLENAIPFSLATGEQLLYRRGQSPVVINYEGQIIQSY